MIEIAARRKPLACASIRETPTPMVTRDSPLIRKEKSEITEWINKMYPINIESFS